MVTGQEQTTELAVDSWDADSIFRGRVLDSGCGLGGGSLYWLNRYDVTVTAVTLAAEHREPIRHFAEQAGVSDRLEVVVGDVTEVRYAGPAFDVAVAMEAACYWNRARWFERLAESMVPGGHVCIEDVFVCDLGVKPLFDGYWMTDIGTRDEYVTAAAAHGFELETDDDITDLTTPFWQLSVAWNECMLERAGAGERDRVQASIAHHLELADIWQRHAIENHLLRFRLS